MSECPLCRHRREKLFSHRVLNRYPADYFVCPGCGLIQCQEPTWTAEAYSDAISALDTGIMSRNLELSDRLTALLSLGFKRSGTYVDIGGGYGILTRIMRDRGFNFFWTDKYAHNAFARGFEAGSAAGQADALAAFEVLEHIGRPLEFLQENFRRFGTKTLVFSTLTYEGPPPGPDWWYYMFATGQHVSFYKPETLSFLAAALGIRYCRITPELHVLSDRPIPAWALRVAGSGLLSGTYAGLYRRLHRRRSKTVTDMLALEDRMREKGGGA